MAEAWNYPMSGTFSVQVEVSQFERCISKLRRGAEFCVVMNENKTMPVCLAELGRVDTYLCQLLTENQAVVRCCRDERDSGQLIIVFEVPEVVIISPKTKLRTQGAKLALDRQKDVLKTLSEELNCLLSPYKQLMVLAADEDCLKIWLINEVYSRLEKEISFRGQSEATKNATLQKAVKGAQKVKWLCLLDQDSGWISEKLEEWNMDYKSHVVAEATINSLEKVISLNDEFLKYKIYWEIKILRGYFSCLEEGEGTSGKGCTETTTALNNDWVKAWIVSENNSCIVYQLQQGKSKPEVVTRFNQDLPVEYNGYDIKRRTPMLQWLKTREEPVILVSSITEQGQKLETLCEGIGVVVVTQYFFP